jgi:pyruvate formate lyase activating enzyme
LKEALHWEALSQGNVRCYLCPNTCVILPGKQGICRVRENREGRLYSVNYGQVASLGLDPVEKKPLFHFHPGGLVLSIGTYGCNFTCRFCQNWQISQMSPSCTMLTPGQIVKLCLSEQKRYPNTVGIAYTYNEPTVWYEFVSECAQEAKAEKLSNVLVTNGYISKEALRELLPSIDALNIDVKAWQDDFYRRIAGGKLKPVLETVEEAYAAGAWVEITYLVIPGENDKEEDMKKLTTWLGKINPAIPLHLSRFFPAYHFHNPPTPFSTLEKLRGIARERLQHVYIGNAWKKGYADTYCARCGRTLLERGALELEGVLLENGACPNCLETLEIVGKVWM